MSVGQFGEEPEQEKEHELDYVLQRHRQITATYTAEPTAPRNQGEGQHHGKEEQGANSVQAAAVTSTTSPKKNSHWVPNEIVVVPIVVAQKQQEKRLKPVPTEHWAPDEIVVVQGLSNTVTKRELMMGSRSRQQQNQEQQNVW